MYHVCNKEMNKKKRAPLGGANIKKKREEGGELTHSVIIFESIW